MSTPPIKTFGVYERVEDAAPTFIPFELVDGSGRPIPGIFRASKRPRLDLVQRMAQQVGLTKEGDKVYNLNTIEETLQEMLVTEIWDPDAVEVVNDDGPPATGRPGAWVAVDDRQRFYDVLHSDRYFIPIQVLGEIMTWLIEETLGHPTGGSKASVPGPEPTGSTSTDVSPSQGSTSPQLRPPSGSTPST